MPFNTHNTLTVVSQNEVHRTFYILWLLLYICFAILTHLYNISLIHGKFCISLYSYCMRQKGPQKISHVLLLGSLSLEGTTAHCVKSPNGHFTIWSTQISEVLAPLSIHLWHWQNTCNWSFFCCVEVDYWSMSLTKPTLKFWHRWLPASCCFTWM